MLPPTVLAVLAELAPAAAERTLDVTRGSQPLVWLETAEKAPRQAAVDRLAALDALHRDERILHRGWGFLAGRAEVDGKPRKIRVPLLSQPVRLERSLLAYRVVPAGDVEVTPLVADRELAAALEDAPGLAAPGWLEALGSRAWLRSVTDATGFTVDAVLGPSAPGPRIPGDGLVLVAAAALFVVRDVFGVGLADSLRSWAARDLSGTALAAVYGGTGTGPATGDAEAPAGSGVDDTETDTGAGDDPVLSPLPLTAPQRRVVRRARTAPITVVSGPPGSGKSHTVVAAALEVVDRGGSVLVATQSPHAAEVLAGLLARYPGPPPVLFGDPAGRAGLEAELTAGADRGVPASLIRSGRARVQAAALSVRAQRTALTRALDLEQRAAALPGYQPLLPGLATAVPGAFDDGVDLDEVRALLAAEPGDGWWARRRARAARRRAFRLLRAAPGVPEAPDPAVERTVREALAAATAQWAAAHLAATGGTDLAAAWSALHDAERELREAVGRAMHDAARGADRWDRDARRAAGALAAALRAGRNRRRELLARMAAAPLVRALPLWIGTVADVEDLLPPEPGLFDLVVIDEASHVDQIRAAPVLARARRALIVGDPRQLRFVSFVSDVDVTQVLDRHGADERLDVRRMSCYDLAAGAAPVTWLAEHHRSVPHLIDFPARRFYGGRVSVLTRTPQADATDAVDVRHVAAAALVKGVNEAEVAAALAVVEELAAAGHRGIGVISPFRAQAEALEAALVTAFPAERIEELRLRVGTVHAFQGSEADAVVVSLGLVDGDSPSRRRFVTDPRLFNVMVTRARRRLVVLTSLTAPGGLIGDYLAHAEGPRAAEPGPEPAGWAAEVAAELDRLEVPVRPGYRVGPWTIDLCAGPVGVFCAVHPDGPAAHLERQGALHRAGWRLIDAFPSRWQGDPRRAALEIAGVVAGRIWDIGFSEAAGGGTMSGKAPRADRARRTPGT
ncbi:AAA domain-containing protein [Actinoplanes oblitus]|uniref:AAA domain-containing protein n=1 Tax=Actinoplanes oblitus TaxID=3040509 RepID=A0ABY8WKZ2_9ACTN|nr:AAA domain-containing protein [Actinoplanes oblitus]WIM98559.1 AAA domain-containing protein [Actinoplanes oblitus]